MYSMSQDYSHGNIENIYSKYFVMKVNLCRLSNVLTRMGTNLIFQSMYAEDLVGF